MLCENWILKRKSVQILSLRSNRLSEMEEERNMKSHSTSHHTFCHARPYIDIYRLMIWQPAKCQPAEKGAYDRPPQEARIQLFSLHFSWIRIPALRPKFYLYSTQKHQAMKSNLCAHIILYYIILLGYLYGTFWPYVQIKKGEKTPCYIYLLYKYHVYIILSLLWRIVLTFVEKRASSIYIYIYIRWGKHWHALHSKQKYFAKERILSHRKLWEKLCEWKNIVLGSMYISYIKISCMSSAWWKKQKLRANGTQNEKNSTRRRSPLYISTYTLLPPFHPRFYDCFVVC